MVVQQFAHFPLTEALAATAAHLCDSTVHIHSGRTGAGAGVIWRPDGLIVTNAHVARTSRVGVDLADGRTFQGEVVATDSRRDLAAVRVAGTDLPAVHIGDSRGLRVGHLVMAIGHPLGLAGALTIGIVHALAPAESRGQGTWVQADIRLAPGNSGGPLADVFGRVVGINSMIAGGLGLAVPSDDVVAFLRREARRGFLGLTTRPVALRVAGASTAGLLILAVEARSPADRAGLRLGDVIIGVAGQPLRDHQDLATAIDRTGAGDVLPLWILRAGERHAIEVVPAERVRATERAA